MSISAPTDLANCKLWLDFNDATQLDSSGGLSYKCNDKSGQGNHAVCQTDRPFTLHKSPLSSRRVGMIGGSGSPVGGYVPIHAVATHLTGNCTIAAVAGGQVASAAGGIYLLGAGRSTTATPLLSMLTASSKWVAHRRNDAATLRTLTSSENATNTLQLHVLVYDGTNLTYRINGVQIGQGTASGAITLDQFALGVSPRDTFVNPGYAIFDTVVVYSDAKSGADLTDLEALLMAYCPALANEITNTLPETFRPMNVRVADSLPVTNGSITGISHTYDSSYADFDDNAGVGLYYVDYYSGNDGNSGVLASPLKTYDAALAKTDLKWVKNKRLITPAGWGASYTRPDRGCGLSPSGVSKNWIINAETGTWSKTAGQTNVYEITRTGTTFNVVDVTAQLPVTGEPASYLSVGSKALCDATQGSYFSSSGDGKVYVHSDDSRAIDVDSGIAVQLTTNLDLRIPFTSPNRPWILKSIGFIDRHNTTQTWDIADSRQFYHDCEFHWSAELSLTNPERVVHYKTKMTNGHSDLFDYRGDVIAVEIECVGDLSGSADADNCSTGHSNAVILSVLCNYSRGSRNVHDIDAVQRQMIGCNSSLATIGAGGADTDVGYFCGANDGGTDSCVMNLYKCRVDGGNVTDLLAEKGCQIICRGMRSSGFTQDARSPGTITFNDEPTAPHAGVGGLIGARIIGG